MRYGPLSYHALSDCRPRNRLREFSRRPRRRLRVPLYAAAPVPPAPGPSGETFALLGCDTRSYPLAGCDTRAFALAGCDRRFFPLRGE